MGDELDHGIDPNGLGALCCPSPEADCADPLDGNRRSGDDLAMHLVGRLSNSSPGLREVLAFYDDAPRGAVRS
jgi:hypothetical protein